VNAPGTYWVRGTDVFGRISSDTIQLIRPIYDSIALQNRIVCYNNLIEETAFVPLGYNFVSWSDGEINQTRLLNQNQTLSYTVSDNSNCTRTSNTAVITIDNTLENISLGNDTSLCIGNIINLQSNPLGITAFLWNTGNTQASQLIDSSGQFVLEVTNTNNCQNRDTIQVTVIGTSPTLNYTFPASICQFSEEQYNDSSFVVNNNGTINNKTWSISEGSFYSGSSGTFAIDTAGTFNVTLLVETEQGCSSSTTFPLVVHPKPIVSFITEKFCPYDAVEFTSFNSQLSSLSSQLWSFDDNTTSTSPNPTHVFGTTGTYNVSLQAQDINGCRDTVTQAVYIQPAPVAAFSFNNTCEETEVNFVNNSTISDTFNISTNAWSYGDGTQAINPSFQKIYADADTFDVQLIVTANNGCQDTTLQSIIIYPRPTLGWQVGPACKNTWTTFENLSSVSVGNIEQTDWLVNLQYSLEGNSSAYQFVTTGVQYLNLTSTTDNGCQRDTLIIVNVQPEINAAYIVSPQTIVAGVPTTFTSTSTGATEYTWNLGNGNIIQTTVAESIEATGFDASLIGDSIQTSLIIENSIGCRDTATKYIKVFEPRIDLAITQLFVQDLNGFYKVGVELSNQGFIEITKTDLLLKMYGSMPILETENESLAPGESRIYLFNASPSAYISTQDNETSYLCVEATSYNDYQLIETELSNNVACLNTEGENFVLLPIYPNPTNDDITYTLILSEEATINTSLTDETGRIVMEQSELHSAGIHTQILSMRNLRAGVYYFHISDGTSAKTVKILKN
jgi:PKD repeat protein